ncbi:MAG: NifB/NifX family molybdenum-iron cluster-binding protein [Bacillota bacterium]|nr:NifB/NifX family molybdenum-iron cluster-binding protein [Bacillota bacterium]
MKIIISSSGKELKSLLDPRFGRCPFYAIYDTEDIKWNFLTNPGALEGSGAGIKASQFLIEQQADVLLTGDVGPNASRILNSAGIKVYSLSEVPIEEALSLYQEGQYSPIVEPTVSSHSGMFSRGAEQKKQTETPVSREKIALATDGLEVAQHFGRCPAYTLVEINNHKVEVKSEIPNPGHEPGFLPRFLGEKRVSCVIAGGMGPKAQDLFAEQGISTITGITGFVEDVIESYLSGNLSEGESFCEHGQDGHVHECEERTEGND